MLERFAGGKSQDFFANEEGKVRGKEKIQRDCQICFGQLGNIIH